MKRCWCWLLVLEERLSALPPATNNQQPTTFQPRQIAFANTNTNTNTNNQHPLSPALPIVRLAADGGAVAIEAALQVGTFVRTEATVGAVVVLDVRDVGLAGIEARGFARRQRTAGNAGVDARGLIALAGIDAGMGFGGGTGGECQGQQDRGQDFHVSAPVGLQVSPTSMHAQR